MLPPDDVTRYLTPLGTAFPDDIMGPETPLTGSVTPLADAPLLSYESHYPHDSLPRPERGEGPQDHDVDVSPAQPLHASDNAGPTPQYSATFVRSPEGHFVPSTHAKHSSATHHNAGSKGGTGHGHHGDGQAAKADGEPTTTDAGPSPAN